MKKIISCILAVVAAMTAMTASAMDIAFSWNIAGAVDIKSSSYFDGTVVGPASDSDTSFTYECESSRWVYVVAREGYKITSAVIAGREVKPTVANGLIFVGKYFSENSDVNVTLAPIERTSNITVDVENGGDWISARFNDGHQVALRNGVNTIGYDPDLETSLNLSPANGAKDFYKITLNGTPLVNRYPLSPSYDVNPLREGDKVVVRVFENGEPVQKDCVVSLSLASGLEGCVNTIRNWTSSDWMTLDSDGSLTVKSGTDLQFNFNGEDYVYTSFKLNGKDVTSDLRNNSLRFTVDDDVLLQVDGSPKDFGTVDFTAYVMNPEGVTLYCGRFGENPADMSGGDAIEEELTIVPPGVPDEITMTSGDTKLYKLSVSAKNPYIYIAPAEGWYIRTVQSSSDGTKGGIPMASPDTPEFYVVAYKLGGYCKADINVHGSVPVRLSGSASLSNMWNNPATTYTIHEGMQTIEFIPDYDLPLSLRTLEQFDNFFVYVDGIGQSPDENNSYSIVPWYSGDQQEDSSVRSLVEVFADGSVPRSGKVKLEAVDGLDAMMYYSAVRHEGTPSGQTLLVGTEVMIAPSDKDCTITVNGDVVNGMGADEKFIDGLDADGEYRFAVTSGTTEIVVSKGCGMVGVKGVDTESIDTPVYTVGGLRIETSDPASLPSGFYIIGNRKVAVRH